MVGGHRTIFSLEAGRAVAALLVAGYHLSYLVYEYYGRYPLGNAFRPGHAGVEYFFVLSGFLMYFIHRKDLGVKGKSFDFAYKRISRIYPLYLITIVPLLLFYFFVPGAFSPDVLNYQHVVADILLFPHDGRMLLGVAWTLKHEMLFYALFLIGIIFGPARLWAVGIWMICVVLWNVVMAGADTGPRGPLLFSSYNLGFGAGIGVGYLVTRSKAHQPFIVMMVGITAFVGLMAYEWFIGRMIPHDEIPLGAKLSPILYVLAASMIVYGGARIDLDGAGVKGAKIQSLFIIGGASSYALYLIHAPAASLLVRVMVATRVKLVPEVAFLVLMISVIAASLVMHYIIERPILAWLRRMLPVIHKSVFGARRSAEGGH